MYMKEALGFNITSSGALAALPYLARLTLGIIFGSIGDVIKKKEVMSVTFIRKFFTIFCKWCSPVHIFMKSFLCYSSCDTGAVAIFSFVCWV